MLSELVTTVSRGVRDQRPRDLGGGRTAGQPDRGALGRPAPPPRGRSAASPRRGGRCGSAAAARRARRGATAPPCVRASRCCSSSRRRSRRMVAGDTPELGGELADADAAVARQALEDAGQPVSLAHARKSTERDLTAQPLYLASILAYSRHEMSAIEREIMTQPADWRSAAGRCGGACRRSSRSPASGSRRSAAARRCTWPRPTRRPARRPGRARPTPSRPRRCPRGAATTGVVAISRSGTTSEVVRLLAASRTDVPSAGDHRGPRHRRAPSAPTAAVVLDFADEESVVQTRFATTALALLLASLGIDSPRGRSDAADARARGAAAGWARRLRPVRRSSAPAGRSAWPTEAALKLREAAGAWTESYPAMEYRHGPISANADDDAGVADRRRRPRRARRRRRAPGRPSPRIGDQPARLARARPARRGRARPRPRPRPRPPPSA